MYHARKEVLLLFLLISALYSSGTAHLKWDGWEKDWAHLSVGLIAYGAMPLILSRGANVRENHEGEILRGHCKQSWATSARATVACIEISSQCSACSLSHQRVPCETLPSLADT